MKDFPNRWEQMKDAPDSAFQELPAVAVMERAQVWELSDRYTIGRCYDRLAGTVTEFAYKQPAALRKRVFSLLAEEPTRQILLCDDEGWEMVTASEAAWEMVDEAQLNDLDD